MTHILMILMFLMYGGQELVSRDSLIVQERRIGVAAPWKLNVDVGNTWHSTDFKTLSGVQTCCTGFRDPAGVNLMLYGLYRFGSIAEQVDLNLAIGLSSISAAFNTRQKELIDYNGDAYSADVEHLLNVRFWALPVGMQVSIPFSTVISLQFGVNAMLPLATSYSMSERLVSPQDVVFETGGTSRNVKSGIVTAASTYVVVPFALSGPAITLTRGWVLQPMISASYALSNLTADNAWNLATAGIGFRITRVDSAVKFDTTRIVIPEEQPVAKQPDKTKQQITISGGVQFADDSTIVNQADITYSVKRRRLAVLPAVYFDSASAEIPGRYRRTVDIQNVNATIENIRDIDVNHSILVILASTLKSNQDANVVITACHAEDGEPQERVKLARARAESIVSYLVGLLGVNQKQLSVKTRALPERFSSTRTITGRAENRRVEFVLRNAPYELPVQADTLLVRQIEKAAFSAYATRPETIRQWRIRIMSGSLELHGEQGMGLPPRGRSIPLTMQQQQVVRRNGGADVIIEVDDAEDGTISNRYRLVTTTSRADNVRPFDEFGIVLFDYNSSRVSEDELGTIDELRTRSTRADYIQITGTADASGNQDYNLKLAGQRALSVARELKLEEGAYELRSQISDDYPVELPEGRMLGRQVKVVMRTGK